MSGIKLIVTSDGSHSLLNEALNETYHSVHGAIRESQHVFIEHGLKYFLASTLAKQVTIFEVGFGTGLNALLTVKALWDSGIPSTYVSVEAFPIDEPLWASLNYTDTLFLKDVFSELHRSPWETVTKISEELKLIKRKTTLESIELEPASFDVVYFDAFAPNKQPDLWLMEILRKVVVALKPKGVFITYCAKGQLKRDLKELGLKVETLPGPPGKKEMVRALKL